MVHTVPCCFWLRICNIIKLLFVTIVGDFLYICWNLLSLCQTQLFIFIYKHHINKVYTLTTFCFRFIKKITGQVTHTGMAVMLPSEFRELWSPLKENILTLKVTGQCHGGIIIPLDKMLQWSCIWVCYYQHFRCWTKVGG